MNIPILVYIREEREREENKKRIRENKKERINIY